MLLIIDSPAPALAIGMVANYGFWLRFWNVVRTFGFPIKGSRWNLIFYGDMHNTAATICLWIIDRAIGWSKRGPNRKCLMVVVVNRDVKAVSAGSVILGQISGIDAVSRYQIGT